jgi:lysophospholipase-2
MAMNIQQIMHTEPNIPIFWGQGESDTEITPRYARESIQFLQQSLGMTAPTLSYIEYPDLQHEVGEDELVDLSCWILSVLNEPNRRNGI